MERSAIIRKLMEDKGMKVSDISRDSGLAYSTVKSILENGIGKASYVNICKICESVGITADKLEIMVKNNKFAEQELSKEDYERIRKYKFISTHSPDGAIVVDTVLNREYSIAQQLEGKDKEIKELKKELTPKRILAYYGKIAAAGKSYGFEDVIAGTIECPLTDTSQRADYAIGVSGDSMEPTYYDGDIVYVKKNVRLNIGDIGIFQKDNGIYIKEVGENCLISHNKYYKPMVNGGTVICLGKVLGKVEID